MVKNANEQRYHRDLRMLPSTLRFLIPVCWKQSNGSGSNQMGQASLTTEHAAAPEERTALESSREGESGRE